MANKEREPLWLMQRQQHRCDANEAVVQGGRGNEVARNEAEVSRAVNDATSATRVKRQALDASWDQEEMQPGDGVDDDDCVWESDRKRLRRCASGLAGVVAEGGGGSAGVNQATTTNVTDTRQGNGWRNEAGSSTTCTGDARGISTGKQLPQQANVDPRRERPHECDYDGCGKAFRFKSRLTKQVAAVHLRERNHACRHGGCGRAFSQKGNLTTHVATVHLRERNHHGDCGQAFSVKGNLIRHVASVHIMERNHVCDYHGCGKAFSQKSSLTKHVRSVHMSGQLPAFPSGACRQ